MKSSKKGLRFHCCYCQIGFQGAKMVDNWGVAYIHYVYVYMYACII